MHFPSIARVALLLVSMLLMTGCAQNTVNLVYTPSNPETIPPAGAPTVCVVEFRDDRSRIEIGQRSDGSFFSPDSRVTEWVSRALAAELTRQGFIVSYAATEEMAQKSGAGHFITGAVEDVWLTEHSSTAYDCQMRASIHIKTRHNSLVKNVFNSSLSRRVIPMSSVPKTMLTDSVAELVHPMALYIRQQIK